VRHADRDDGGRAGFELEALLASLKGESSLEYEVALVLGMGMKRRRGVTRKQELDLRETALGYLPRQLDRCQGAQKPEPLALSGA
jgi:hypothetical protein